MLLLFTDGSVNVQTNTGYGACLAIHENEIFKKELNSKIKIKRFENTSSTKLELQTLLWALSEITIQGQAIRVFTDSQNIVQLPKRRQKLEQKNFLSKKGIPLKNSEWYKLFFQVLDSGEFEFKKIKGHQQSRNKNQLEKVFSLVDKASRNALRNNPDQ